MVHNYWNAYRLKRACTYALYILYSWKYWWKYTRNLDTKQIWQNIGGLVWKFGTGSPCVYTRIIKFWLSFILMFGTGSPYVHTRTRNFGRFQLGSYERRLPNLILQPPNFLAVRYIYVYYIWLHTYVPNNTICNVYVCHKQGGSLRLSPACTCVC